MSLRLSGKSAIITGAAGGIGRAAVARFVAEGADVLALDSDAVGLALLDGCTTRTIDLCDATAVATLATGISPPDILFLCAGYVATGTILDCDDTIWDRSIAVNVTAMMRLIRVLLPGMIAHGGGSIITMSSVAGSVRGVPDRFAYATTKAAIVGLTKAIAADFVRDGIRCNAICPGTIDTPALRHRMHATDDYKATLAAYAARQPMNRLGSADEIASLALYLASDESNFTTGQCLIADGGWAN